MHSLTIWQGNAMYNLQEVQQLKQQEFKRMQACTDDSKHHELHKKHPHWVFTMLESFLFREVVRLVRMCWVKQERITKNWWLAYSAGPTKIAQSNIFTRRASSCPKSNAWIPPRFA
mmetsp:Transcript_57017/g.113374  ORF Transcript_57017/g.113374 Transcript_57017/m.113374 type:complete len:116 (-) Transcript_57017:472-819(-)